MGRAFRQTEVLALGGWKNNVARWLSSCLCSSLPVTASLCLIFPIDKVRLVGVFADGVIVKCK